MEQHVRIEVSLELSSVCIVDGSGKVLKEAKVGVCLMCWSHL
jgi:hypothetical protein